VNKITDLIRTNFDETHHEYLRNDNDYLLAGVTSITGILNKPYLKPWAVKLCAEYAIANYEVGMNKTAFSAMITEAKKQHTVRLKEAGQTGTDMHAVLEEHVLARMSGNTDSLKIENEMQLYAYNQFLNWERDNNVKWRGCEMLIGDIDNEFAGRLDAVAEVDGTLTMIDFKTSNQISEEYHLQTAGYVAGLRWMAKQGMIKKVPAARLIIRLPKTLTKEVYDRKTKKYHTEPNELEIYPVKTDLEFDIETFLACRKVFKWRNQNLLKKD